MKKISLVLIALLIIGLITSPVFAETIRQGDVRFSFNPTNEVTKTAAYTVVAGDSLIKVTAATANITITLPTVLSTRPGKKAYKIQKTDGTAYAVIVSPATGDTIGGESQRYLFGKNDYIVVSTGLGSDWDVAFESPYVAENYEEGRLQINAPSSNSLYGSSESGFANTPAALKTVYGYITLNSAGVATVASIGMTSAASKTALFNSTNSMFCFTNVRTSAAASSVITVSYSSTTTIIITASPTFAHVVDYFCAGY